MSSFPHFHSSGASCQLSIFALALLSVLILCLAFQYERFWKDPSKTSVAWIGLLYAIMCLSAQYYVSSNSNPDPHHTDLGMQPQYLDQVVQCLNLADYPRGGPYVLEALIHYFAIEHFRCRDTEPSVCVVFGIIIRLALHMGCHRDPRHLPAITPFQGEMRRRIWAILHSGDVMLSMQIGCPRMISDDQWDTAPPRSLLDNDFDEDCEVLPPSRPESEVTSVLYIIARHRLFNVMGTIADMSTTVRP